MFCILCNNVLHSIIGWQFVINSLRIEYINVKSLLNYIQTVLEILL